MTEKEESLLQHVDDLKKIISVRKKHIIATMATMKEREEVIEDRREEVKRRDIRIPELQKEIGKKRGVMK